MSSDAKPTLVFPQTPEDRLRLALRRLQTALSQQSDAVATFRESLVALRQATGNLSDQVHSYQDTLGQTADKVRDAHDVARRLERSAETLASVAR
jgi:ABC-type transporter Mla subunit MlaD